MRLRTRPTWLAVTVAAVTGYCVGHPGPLVGAFREDGLAFVVVGFALVGVVAASVADVRRERAAARLPTGFDRMRDAMTRAGRAVDYDRTRDR